MGGRVSRKGWRFVIVDPHGDQCVVQSGRAHRVACAPHRSDTLLRLWHWACQLDGEQVQELHPGDTAMIPPDTRHWYGAAPDRIFVHLAMSEVNDQREGTAWFEKVTDGDYGKPTASAK